MQSSGDSDVFSDRYRLVAEANRRNYSERARRYASSCSCVHREDLQHELDALLAEGLELANVQGRAPKALDACGGSGNAARKLIERGCETTLADISQELVDLFRADCAKQGVSCTTAVGEIGQFLLDTEDRYDVIVFSSALHHLEDPYLVLSLAIDRLAPGGVIVTMFDPCPVPRPARMLISSMRIASRVAHEPSLLLTRTGPVLKRVFRRQSKERLAQSQIELTNENVGFIAEYHGLRGVRDLALAERLRGLDTVEVVEHRRYIGGQIGRSVRFVLRSLRAPNRFSLILKRPEDAVSAPTAPAAQPA